MRRVELEDAIRAATEIIAQDSIIVIGSQSILGTYTEDQLPEQATQSVEVDMAPLSDDDAATLSTKLDGAIGELSMFHQTHGYYVQGVGRDTAVLPEGWENRLVAVSGPNTNGAPGSAWTPTTSAWQNSSTSDPLLSDWSPDPKIPHQWCGGPTFAAVRTGPAQPDWTRHIHR